MSLDRKKFSEEISKIRRIKASHITDGQVNELIRRSMNGDGGKPSKLDIEVATSILESQGYRVNTGIGKGYVNRNFSYRL